MIYPEITTISKEELANYPVRSFEGTIHVVDDLDKAEKAAEFLSKHNELGFDTETRPSFTKHKTNSVALLQLSTETDAFLFQLRKIGMPLSVVKLLSAENIVKTGVAVHDDVRCLQKLRDFTANNFIDLQTIAKQLNIEAMGLKRLTPIALDFRISKRQQLSNWDNDDLTEAQKLYAATDAWVSLKIYQKLLPYTL